VADPSRLALCVAAILASGCVTPSPRHGPSGATPHSHGTASGRSVDASISINSPRLFRDDDALFSYVKRFGLVQTIARLNELAPTNGDCHQPAHKAGRMAYAIYGVTTFKSPPLDCHAGGLHGAIEAYFSERGVATLAAAAHEICGGNASWFVESQCVHGIGHGLMAWSDYELPDALTHCDLLDADKDACYTGVFMENIVGSLGSHHSDHPSRQKYLSDDPQYPCTIVADQYKPSCYFLQTSRMLQLFGVNFSRIALTCAAAPAPYQQACFSSMGRDIGGVYRRNPVGAIRACSAAPPGAPRIACLTAAVQDEFWDARGQASAVQFCRSLTTSAEKDACYDCIFARAREMLTAPGNVERFCLGVERDYQSACLNLSR
jgi:hypothetical protein